MAIAALLATASSTNATLYASSNLTGMLAKQGLFPRSSAPSRVWAPRAGLFITAALVLVVANLVDLSAIASVGSAVALVIFLLVGAAGTAAGGHRQQPVIVVLAIAVTATVLAFFAVDTLESAPETFGAIIGIGLLSVVLDTLVRRGRPRPTTAKPTRPRSLGIANRLSAPRPQSPAT